MTELFLGLLALGITVFGYVLVQLADTPNLPPDLWRSSPRSPDSS
jgi:hypothetical protein